MTKAIDHIAIIGAGWSDAEREVLERNLLDLAQALLEADHVCSQATAVQTITAPPTLQDIQW